MSILISERRKQSTKMQNGRDAEPCFRCGKWFTSKQMLWIHRRSAHPESLTSEAGARMRQLAVSTATTGSSVPVLMDLQVNPWSRILSVSAGPRPTMKPPMMEVKEEIPTMQELHLEPLAPEKVTQAPYVPPSAPPSVSLPDPSLQLYTRKQARMTEMIETCCRGTRVYT